MAKKRPPKSSESLPHGPGKVDSGHTEPLPPDVPDIDFEQVDCNDLEPDVDGEFKLTALELKKFRFALYEGCNGEVDQIQEIDLIRWANRARGDSRRLELVLRGDMVMTGTQMCCSFPQFEMTDDFFLDEAGTYRANIKSLTVEK